MKKLNIIFIITFTILLVQCKSNYVPEYIWPDYLADWEVEDHKDMAADGFELYKKYCGECHGITHKGKDDMPNFTKDEIDAYNDAYELGDPTNHAVIYELTEKDVEYIFLFLEFRKK
ncbi:MAG: cytochrome c [Bacteroidia bacterium]